MAQGSPNFPTDGGFKPESSVNIDWVARIYTIFFCSSGPPPAFDLKIKTMVTRKIKETKSSKNKPWKEKSGLLWNARCTMYVNCHWTRQRGWVGCWREKKNILKDKESCSFSISNVMGIAVCIFFQGHLPSGLKTVEFFYSIPALAIVQKNHERRLIDDENEKKKKLPRSDARALFQSIKKGCHCWS